MIEVRAPASAASVLAERVTDSALRKFDRKDLAAALGLVPGVAIANVGPRNEGNAYVRGFDLRQVPLYIDGIPVYVPYDGYVDLHRFTTFELSEITVSKGMSSVLNGPNAMGGSINLVTRRPVGRLELMGGAGTFTGGGYQTYLNAGFAATGGMPRPPDRASRRTTYASRTTSLRWPPRASGGGTTRPGTIGGPASRSGSPPARATSTRSWRRPRRAPKAIRRMPEPTRLSRCGIGGGPSGTRLAPTS